MAKRSAAFFLPFLLILFSIFLPGCSRDSGANQILRYNMSDPIYNLDPQFADDPNEIMVILNTFEGLVSKNSKGEIVLAGAESFTVSPDGKTYRFILRKDAFWSKNYLNSEKEDPVPVTAYDYVFAFYRMFQPDSPSPYAQSFFVLENAREVLENTMLLYRLGIKAVDEYTLEFQLSTPDSFFLELLTSPAAMPCQQDFFEESKGKYGLSPSETIYNGPFTVTYWDNSRRVSLRRNESYHSADSVVPMGVNLYIGKGVEQNQSLLLGNSADAAPVLFEDLEALQQANCEIVAFENTAYLLLFNLRDPVFSHNAIRQGMARSVNRELFLPYLEDNLSPATEPIPPAAQVNGISYREAAGRKNTVAFQSELAAEHFQTGLTALGISKLPKSSILCLDSGQHKFLSGFLQQQWQKDLNLYINIEAVAEADFWARISNGDFNVAVVPFTLSQPNPSSFLEDFLDYLEMAAELQSFPFSTEILQDYLTEAASSSTPEEAIAALSAGESFLTDNAFLVPLYYETSYFASVKGVSGIDFSPYAGNIFFWEARLE